MKEKKRNNPIYPFFVFCFFCIIFSLPFVRKNQSNEDVKQSPIFERALKRTLNTWDKQSKTIQWSTLNDPLDNLSIEPAIKKLEEIIEISQEDQLGRTQDPNTP